MRLLSSLGQVFRPVSQKVESRAGFTDTALEDALNIATGNAQSVAEQTAAAEFAIGLLSRCFAAAIVEPDGIGPALPAAFRADLARRLLIRGEALYAIEVNSLGVIRLLPASSHDIAGGPDESSWRYYLDLPGPTELETRRLPGRAVVHVRIGNDPATPWKGCSPLENAGLTARVLARLEHRTGQESGAQVGYLLPVPDGTSDEATDALKKDLKGLEGKVALVESRETGSVSRAAAPPSDWRLQRFGAAIPEGNVALRRQVGADVCAALGIPAALFVGADGATVREAYRQLLVSTLQPLGVLIGDELERKLELPAVRFNFRRLAAADIAARARAYGTLIQADVAAGLEVDRDRAALLAGLNE